ncbi:hypothetical protein [Deinococcus humi]|uniref:Uncharacterized protein n=1 Tax=Deinococcus humi TaxID=662880 RepID=A0A7W8JQA4_9DEIO|nr:hypothetical protein [Deinococcus humi]MBB5361236.1 hypothetical protein [Deinococcus humi]
MNTWIRRFRLLFAPPRPATVSASGLLFLGSDQNDGHSSSLGASVPPITDLDLLRALGCDV